MIVIERDELGLTEADYLEMMELFPDFSSPKDDSQPIEPALSNEEIEVRLRRKEVARLLTGPMTVRYRKYMRHWQSSY